MATRTEDAGVAPTAPDRVVSPAAAAPGGGTRRGRWIGGVLTAVVGAALGVGAVALQLRYLFAPNPSDPGNYALAALQFPGPPADPLILHQYLRLGLIVPMSLAMDAFGYSQASYYAVPLLTALLLPVSIYAIGRMLFSRAVGVAAGVLASVSSLVFGSLGQPLPDATATAVVTAAVAVAVGVATGQPLLVRTGRRKTAALLLVGALLGWSYLIREYIVFVWPVIPVLLWRRAGWRGLLVVAIPLVAVAAGETALNAALHGDPLARWAASAGHGDLTARPELDRTFKNFPRSTYLLRFWERLGQSPDRTWLRGAVLVMLAGAAFGVLRWRRAPAARWLALFGLWSVAFYVPMVLLGGVLDPSGPRLRLQLIRYWVPLAPAIMLGACGAVWLAGRWVLRHVPGLSVRRAGALAGVALLLGSAVAARDSFGAWSHRPVYRVNGATHLEQFRTWLRSDGDGVRRIWSDQRTLMVLPIFFSEPFGAPVWRGETDTLAPGSARPAPGDHVVVYPECGHCTRAMRAVLGPTLQPRPGWEPVFATADRGLVVYRVADPSG